jgi:hypothetical protein
MPLLPKDPKFPKLVMLFWVVGGKFWNMFCGVFVICRAPGRWKAPPDPLLRKLVSVGLCGGRVRQADPRLFKLFMATVSVTG